MSGCWPRYACSEGVADLATPITRKVGRREARSRASSLVEPDFPARGAYGLPGRSRRKAPADEERDRAATLGVGLGCDGARPSAARASADSLSEPYASCSAAAAELGRDPALAEEPLGAEAAVAPPVRPSGKLTGELLVVEVAVPAGELDRLGSRSQAGSNDHSALPRSPSPTGREPRATGRRTRGCARVRASRRPGRLPPRRAPDRR